MMSSLSWEEREGFLRSTMEQILLVPTEDNRSRAHDNPYVYRFHAHVMRHHVRHTGWETAVIMS